MKNGHRELEFTVPADTVWKALVAPGLRDWYYRLTPEGDFVESSHIRWRDVAGGVAEESDVVAATAPKRLAFETRFVFAPNLAALEPHRLEWQVTPLDAGCCSVRLTWEAGEQVAGMMEAEGENMLLALQVAVDPTVQAELARLESIGPIEIRDLTPERISDYLRFFDHEAFRDYPAWRACYCHETHRTEPDDGTRSAEQNRSDMVELINQGGVTALLAYADGKPVGWCNYGETTALGGVMQRFKLEPADHQGTGSISCFIITAPYRGHGVASRLLETAITRLRDRGMKSVEAYPARDDRSPQANYRGPLSMFLRAGFEPYREAGRHLVVRKAL